jgi:acetoacetate decarboxylase
MVRSLAGAVLFGAIAGCGVSSRSLGEQYELSDLHVVFLDESQIQAKWKEVTGKPAVMMTPRLVLESQRREEVVVGFYDFQTRTIYCPKMNFEVCGHELHHAVLGRFHLER